jgi:hypothetical protein
MAAKKKAARKMAGKHKVTPFNFTVEIEGTKVVVKGKNDGNIRARKQPLVSFVAGQGVDKFKIDATEFVENDCPDPPARAWPFKKSKPIFAVSSFTSALIKPEKGASLLIFKYTITVHNCTPADPVIIIEK